MHPLLNVAVMAARRAGNSLMRNFVKLDSLTVEAKGKKVDFDVEVGSKLEDPWRMDTGFSVQMVFIFIDTDGKSGSGFTDGLPGLNIKFDPASAWDRVIVLSPQTSALSCWARSRSTPGSQREATPATPSLCPNRNRRPLSRSPKRPDR